MYGTTYLHVQYAFPLQIVDLDIYLVFEALYRVINWRALCVTMFMAETRCVVDRLPVHSHQVRGSGFYNRYLEKV